MPSASSPSPTGSPGPPPSGPCPSALSRDATLRLLGLVPAWRTRLAAELAGLRS
ncbi:hypothetical protein LUW77_04520 [Streptomyces radiopugnans]|nr:hypothetical protein LUW77_04520 [Streptomyces radiopugnans]